MRIDKRFLLLPLPLLLAACVSMPNGPNVLVLPGTSMSFEQFRMDEAACRQYAEAETGQSAEGAAASSAAQSAAIGTAVGAVAGAIIGGRSGAGVGAGTGLIVGSASGAGSARVSGDVLQRRYDNAYIQCMYAKGHRVPVAGNFSPEPQRTPAQQAAPQYPPPNQPPPAQVPANPPPARPN
ncbi:MAG TPA: glycine zipper family protein [Candidatus Desulfobacillus sp.]|nr:glycine zipper family protein [Candidatus Desulfobacillus sp.]